MRYLVILLTLSGCSLMRPNFKAFSEQNFICEDTLQHRGCVKFKGDYDNIDLHGHDPREIESIEVPN